MICDELFSKNKFPSQWVSVLIASYNTKPEYIRECLESIQNQKGKFGIEIVWINDGSEKENSVIQKNLLDLFVKKNSNNNYKVKYKKMDQNKGLSYCLHEGVLLCSYDLIIRMDADDIMNEYRIQKQVNFMNENPKCVLLGTNMSCFIEKNDSDMDDNNDKKKIVDKSHHSELITWEEYIKTKPHWIMNHPTLCFRKYAVINVGNYNKTLKLPFEDLELELRLLKEYKFAYNLLDYLLLYRIHENQITFKNRKYSKRNTEMKNELINNIIKNENNPFHI